MKLYPSIEIAKQELREADILNPGKWVHHSQYVAIACEKIAENIKNLDAEKAFVTGLLHDIGRRAGVSSIRHIIDGYRYCEAKGWPDAARICLTHSYPIQNIETDIGQWDMPPENKEFIREFISKTVYDDYDKLVQLCDALATGDGICIMEKRFVDVTRRYGFQKFTIDRWNAYFEIKEYFENLMGRSIYEVLPNVAEAKFR